MLLTETIPYDLVFSTCFKSAESSNHQRVKSLSLQLIIDLLDASPSLHRILFDRSFSDAEIELYTKQNAVWEILTGKYLKQFLSIKKVIQDCEEGFKLLIIIKKLMPDAEEIDEIIFSKLKPFRIKEIVESL